MRSRTNVRDPRQRVPTKQWPGRAPRVLNGHYQSTAASNRSHRLLEQSALFKLFTKSAPQAPTKVVVVLQPLFIGGYDDIHEGTTVRRGELFPDRNWRLPLAKRIVANSSASYRFFRDAIRNIQARFSSGEDSSVSFYVEPYSPRHRIRSPEKSADFLDKLDDLESYIRSLGAEPVRG